MINQVLSESYCRYSCIVQCWKYFKAIKQLYTSNLKLERPIICLQISKVLDMKGPKFYLSKFEIERFITVVPPYVQFLFA